MIRTARLEDAASIADIYNYYIEHTVITFETDLVDEAIMKSRIEKILPSNLYIVYDVDGQVIGYAYASSWRTRIAYQNSLETTVYLKNGLSGQGIGTALYQELLKRMTDHGLHVAIGCITIPNTPSIALHEKLGFEKVGIFHEVGNKFDQWLDVGFWEKKLQ